MKLVTVRVKLEEDDPEPDQKLDEGEAIVKRIVPVNELYQVLLDYDKKGFTVDARLSHWALGFYMGLKHRE